MARGPARILLVDDEQAVQTLLTYPLRKEGYEVVAGDRRAGGPRPLRRAALRPGRARHHAAEARRDRGLPPAANPQPGADHHAHREGGRDRQGRRASRWAPTTTSPSPSRCASSAAASRPRCAAAAWPDAGPPASEPIRAGELEIDFERRAVKLRGDDGPAHLRRVRDPRRARRAPRAGCSRRETLLEHVWGDSTYRDPRTVDVHIRHLREKLEARPQAPRVPVHGARRRLPLPRQRAGLARPEVRG